MIRYSTKLGVTGYFQFPLIQYVSSFHTHPHCPPQVLTISHLDDCNSLLPHFLITARIIFLNCMYILHHPTSTPLMAPYCLLNKGHGMYLVSQKQTHNLPFICFQHKCAHTHTPSQHFLKPIQPLLQCPVLPFSPRRNTNDIYHFVSGNLF